MSKRWEYVEAGPGAGVFTGKFEIRLHWPGSASSQEIRDVCKLIAAAPELLEACKAAREWLNRFGEHSPVVFGGEQELDDKLKAAIARAESTGCASRDCGTSAAPALNRATDPLKEP